MGEGFLIDTNILIYYLADEIPSEELPKVEEILKNSFNVSIITKIEFLGGKGILLRALRNPRSSSALPTLYP